MKFTVAAITFFVGLGINVEQKRLEGTTLEATFGFGVAMQSAQAQSSSRQVARRTARRTSRRTSARMNYYNRLPGNCVRRIPYYYCGGVYYEETVQNGNNVYVIVTP